MSDVSDASATPSTSTPQHADARPTKRRRLGDHERSTPRPSSALVRPASPEGSISSDGSGSVPTSPSFANLAPTHPLSTAYAAAQANPGDPESADYTQVTRCQWKDCPEPEQRSMDNLVEHINDKHIPPRQKKYFCEWEGCTRKALPHTSAYALKAHMRSHTKEKPFMCQVPECDRSFTRSDALAKHMRTVHETEALRPSDPVPRGHTGGIAQVDTKANGTPANGNLLGRKLKLTFKGGNKTASNTENATSTEPKVEGPMPTLPTIGLALAAGLPDPKLAILDPDESREEGLAGAVDMDSLPLALPVDPTYYPPEIYKDMEEDEKHLPPSQWFRLLRRQIRWAIEDGKDLEKELAELKATTDDLRGNPIMKTAMKEDEVGDVVRREEWGIIENLLERIANTELDVAGSKVQNSNGSRMNTENTSGQSGENQDTSKVFEKIKDLPYWKREPKLLVNGQGTK